MTSVSRVRIFVRHGLVVKRVNGSANISNLTQPWGSQLYGFGFNICGIFWIGFFWASFAHLFCPKNAGAAAAADKAAADEEEEKEEDCHNHKIGKRIQTKCVTDHIKACGLSSD